MSRTMRQPACSNMTSSTASAFADAETIKVTPKSAPVRMELHHLESRTRSSKLDRIVDNGKRASDFLKRLALEARQRFLEILPEARNPATNLNHLPTLRHPP